MAQPLAVALRKKHDGHTHRREEERQGKREPVRWSGLQHELMKGGRGQEKASTCDGLSSLAYAYEMGERMSWESRRNRKERQVINMNTTHGPTTMCHPHKQKPPSKQLDSQMSAVLIVGCSNISTF